MRLADIFRSLTVILLGLALFGLARLPFVQTCSDAAGQPEVCVSLSAVESEGWKTVLLFVLPPLLLALGAAISRNPQFTILASAVIFGLAVFGIASVGLFLIPAALTSFVAVATSVSINLQPAPPTE